MSLTFRRLIPVLAAAVLAACQASGGASLSVTPSNAKGVKATPTPGAPGSKSPSVKATGMPTPARAGAIAGIVRVPTQLLGNDGGSLLGNDAGSLLGNDAGSFIGHETASLLGNDAGSYALLATASQAALAGVPVVLADAAGTPIDGVAETHTDALGRFHFPQVPGGFGYQVLVKSPAACGTGQLRALATAGDEEVGVDLATTLVTQAALKGRSGALRPLDAAVYGDAVAVMGGSVKLSDLPKLCDDAAIAALSADMISRVGALETGMRALTTRMDTLSADMAILRQQVAELAGRTPSAVPTPAAATIAASVAVGAAPRALLFDPAGTLWVANYKDASVTRVAKDRSTLRIEVGESPLGMAVGPDGDVWVTAYAKNQVTRLAPDGTVKGAYPAGDSPFGVVVTAANAVYVTNYKVKTVTQLSAEGVVLGTFPTGARPFGLALDGTGAVWTTNNAEHTVTKLGAAVGTAGQTFVTDRVPHHIQFDATGHGWVTCTGSNRLTKLDASGKAVGSFDTGGLEPWGLALGKSGEVWVTNTHAGAQSVARFNAAGERTGLWSLGDLPQGIAVDAEGRAWVALQEANKVVRLAP